MPDNEQPLRPEVAAMELGTSGVRQFSGQIRDEFLTELKGDQKFDIYREMQDNDPVVGAMLTAIKLLMRQAEWPVKPADKSQQAIRDAEFLRRSKRNLHEGWESTLADILSMLGFGFSVHEIVYEEVDGEILWRKLPIRRQETIWKWQFGRDLEDPEPDDDDIVGLEQRVPTGSKNIEIPAQKFLLFRPIPARGNPEGKSVLRSAYTAWFYKKRLKEVEAISIERSLAGLPIAWVPPEILDQDADTELQNMRTKFRDITQNVRQDEQAGLVLPLAYDSDGNKLYDFELASSPGEFPHNPSDVIERYDSRILMSALADFLSIGHDAQHGSFALASSKTNLFSVAIEAWLDAVEDVFNNQAIPRLFAVNGMGREEYPKLKHGDVEKIDLEVLGQYINRLSGANFDFSDQEQIRDALLDMADLPREDTDSSSPENQPERSEVQTPEGGQDE